MNLADIKIRAKQKALNNVVYLRERIVGFLSLLADVYRNPREWWHLASPVWKCLVAGYLVVYVSFQIPFEPVSSGAVLVLAALAADLLLPRTGLYRAYGEHAAFKGVQVTGDNQKNWNFRGIFLIPQNETRQADKLVVESTLTVMFPEPRPSLYQIASDFEKGKEKRSMNYGWWQIHQTFERVQKIVHNCIVFSGIVGTIIWGYGHLVIDCAECT